MPKSRLSLVTRLLFVLLTISVFLSIFFPQLFPFTQEEAANWVKSSSYDRFVFVTIQVVQVLIPPISHYFTSMLGGYIYGPLEGGLLNLLGRLVGQFMAFGLAYKAAGVIQERRSADLQQFQHLVAGKGGNLSLRALIIFTMIALPFFPDDELSYAMGFARFPIPLFALVTVFGHVLGSFALAFLGSGEEFRGPLFLTLAGVTLACFGGLTWASVRYRRARRKEEATKTNGG